MLHLLKTFHKKRYWLIDFLKSFHFEIVLNSQDMAKIVEVPVSLTQGFTGSPNGKEFACQFRRHSRCGFNPQFRKIPLKEDVAMHQSIFCLEKPVDRGAWRATVHGVAKSGTWLKWCTHTSLAQFHNYNYYYVYNFILKPWAISPISWLDASEPLEHKWKLLMLDLWPLCFWNLRIFFLYSQGLLLLLINSFSCVQLCVTP